MKEKDGFSLSVERWSAIILIILIPVASCAPLPRPDALVTDEEREAARRQCLTQYTVGGAAIGGIMGGLIGRKRPVEGALIGVVAGGALAYAIAWGHCFSLYSNITSQPSAGYQHRLLFSPP